MELRRGLEHKEQLRELEGLSEDFIAPYLVLSEGSSPLGVRLLTLVTSDRARGSGLNLHQGRFRWDIRGNFFMESGVRHLHRVPRAVEQSPSLERFRKCMDVAH